MIIRLEKKNRVTTDFVQIETKDHLLFFHEGKVRRSSGIKSTKHCGTPEKANQEFEKLKKEYINKNYKEVNPKIRFDDFNGVYDKAKWHFGGDFPDELDSFQGHIYTGFYLTWLIENDLFENQNDPAIKAEILKIKNREITGANFYKEFLDGVFMDEDLTDVGIEFSYFYFEKGTYLDDYADALSDDLPSIYHIKDNWDNYKRIKVIVDKRFNKWKKSKNKKWWNFFKMNTGYNTRLAKEPESSLRKTIN